MTPYGYGPYGGLPDPYQVPEDATPLDIYEAMLNGQVTLAALHVAENPQYQYMIDPATGEIARWADGTPMIERVPMEQRMGPIVRHQMMRRTRARLLVLAAPALVTIGMAVLMLLPESAREAVLDFLPYVATFVVWGGAAGAVAYVLLKIVFGIFGRNK